MISIGVQNGNFGEAIRRLRKKLAQNSQKQETLIREYPKRSERKKVKQRFSMLRKARSARRFRDYLKRNQFF